MSLNRNFIDTFKMLYDVFKYNIMLTIILCSIVLCILFIYNKKLSKYLIIIINLILVFLIGKYYISDIISFKFSNPINNMYFYFFNSFIFIVVITIQAIFNLLVTYDYIFYSIYLIFISFSLFMTHYLYNISNIVILNIFPMIKFGNILMFIYYITFLTKLGYHVIIKTTSKRSGRL